MTTLDDASASALVGAHELHYGKLTMWPALDRVRASLAVWQGPHGILHPPLVTRSWDLPLEQGLRAEDQVYAKLCEMLSRWS